MKSELYGILLKIAQGSIDSSKIIYFVIIALLILICIRADRKNKKRYDKMMASVMAASENEYGSGGADNTCVWQSSVDAAAVNAYREEYGRLKLRNLWDVIKIFIIVFAIGIPMAWIMYKDGSVDSFGSFIGKIIMPVVLLFLFIVVVHLRSPSAAMISDDSVIYRRLVPVMVKSLFGADAVYSRTHALDSMQLKKLNFYEHRPEEIKGSDYISGVYKGVQFECSYEDAEYTERDGEGDEHTYSTFRGIMLVIPYRKNSGSMLGLRGRTEQEIKDRTGMHSFGNRIDRMENDRFNRLYFIMSRDDENLYYMLTPDTMEKLITLYENFGGFSERLHVCFSEDLLYIGAPLGNYLRHKSVAPSAGALEKVQQKMWKDLNVVRAVLDLALTF